LRQDENPKKKIYGIISCDAFLSKERAASHSNCTALLKTKICAVTALVIFQIAIRINDRQHRKGFLTSHLRRSI